MGAWILMSLFWVGCPKPTTPEPEAMPEEAAEAPPEVPVVVPEPATAKPASAEPDAEVQAKAEAAVIESIQLLREQKFDNWISKYCDPQRCHDAQSKDEWKAYQLKQAGAHAKSCLGEGDTLDVARWVGDLKEGKYGKVFVKCEGRQLPVPVELRQDDDGRIWISQLSF